MKRVGAILAVGAVAVGLTIPAGAGAKNTPVCTNPGGQPAGAVPWHGSDRGEREPRRSRSAGAQQVTPALAIGVDRLVIVATDPPRHPAPDGTGAGEKPDFDDALLNVFQATLNDPLIEDLHSLVRVNSLLAASGRQDVDGRQPYEYMFAGPERHGTIGQTAAKILRERFGGPLRALDDFAVLNRLLGRQGQQEAELQSYLLFESDFIDRLIAMGYETGERAWQRGWLNDELP